MNLEQFRLRCEDVFKNLGQTGQSYDLFEKMFSARMEPLIQTFPEDQRADAIEIAREFGYETPEKIDENCRHRKDSGYCFHGFPENCCPLGCDEDLPGDW